MQGQVEDTKGNNGEVGQLHITNLRLIWTSQRSIRMNLTVGYNCIVSMNIRQAASRLRGACLLACPADTVTVCQNGALRPNSGTHIIDCLLDAQMQTIPHVNLELAQVPPLL